MLVGVYLIIVLVVNSWDTHIKYGMFDITSTVINGLKVTLLETNSKHYGDTVTGKLMIMEFNLHILIMSCWLMFSQWGILVGLVMDYQTACWVLMRNQIALQYVSNYEIRAKKWGKSAWWRLFYNLPIFNDYFRFLWDRIDWSSDFFGKTMAQFDWKWKIRVERVMFLQFETPRFGIRGECCFYATVKNVERITRKSHVGHGVSNGASFSLVKQKNFWYCFSCCLGIFSLAEILRKDGRWP